MCDLQINQLQGNLPSCTPGVPPGPRLVKSHKESISQLFAGAWARETVQGQPCLRTS